MRIFVCDDDSKIRDIIVEKVRVLYPEAELMAFDSGERLCKETANSMPDIVLLDIQMPGTDGMETARRLRDAGCDAVMIFITGVPDYVFDAFDVHAFHYLVKPVSDDKLKAVLEDAVRIFGAGRGESKTDASSLSRDIMIHSGGAHIRIVLDDLYYAEVFNRKIVLHTRSGIVEYYGKLSELEKMTGTGFYRSHRGYLVNLKYVEKYSRTEVELPGGNALIARQNYSGFVRAYLDYHQRKRATNGH